MRELSFNLERAIAPQPIVLEPLTATENGTYTPALGVNGYSSVEVAVPIPPAPVLTTLSVSENGTYLPPEGTDGFDSVEVDVPEDTIYMEGNISDAFRNGTVWDFIKDRIEFGKITAFNTAWSDNHAVGLTIPTLTIDASLGAVENPFFQTSLQYLPNLIVENPQGYLITSRFSMNYSTNLIEFKVNGKVRPSSSFIWSNQFYYCYKLRYVDEEFLGYISTSPRDSYGGFRDCYSLDEIHNYPVMSNYRSFIQNSCRLKSFTFIPDRTLDTGNITVYLINVGYVPSGIRSNFLNYTTFTTETEIVDAASYQALKNNNDCWTMDITYSRYNRASAAETLTSLPTNSGSGNPVIQFVGNMGANTDAGAINTLTAEEIAVATTKGWTVSYE